MSTSDKEKLRLCSRRYVLAAAMLLIFGCVYESFSHEVYSPWMIFAFAIPLLLGLGPLLAYAALFRRTPDGWALLFWNWALCAWTAGSLLKGALAIYGTTNRLLAVYPVAGAVLALAAVCAEISSLLANAADVKSWLIHRSS